LLYGGPADNLRRSPAAGTIDRQIALIPLRYYGTIYILI
jgi:hypothetical protein